MGNWRTVQLLGSCAPEEVHALREACRLRDDFQNFHPLTDGAGILGLNAWADTEIDRVGNLADRDYTVGDVSETLRTLVTIAPSLALKVHCGNDHESLTCVATITVAAGSVVVGPPEIQELPELGPDEISAGLAYALQRAAPRSRLW